MICNLDVICDSTEYMLFCCVFVVLYDVLDVIYAFSVTLISLLFWSIGVINAPLRERSCGSDQGYFCLGC